MGHSLREQIRERLSAEVGTIRREAEAKIALVYPSPYRVAMSSLGYQTIYRLFNQAAGWACERAFLPDDVAAHRRERALLVSYESETPLSSFPVLALSVAYELELAGLIDCLELAGLPAVAS